jgi:hypothetical protein
MAKIKKNEKESQLEVNSAAQVAQGEETLNEIETLDLIKAEKLQKSGWQLIDCHQTPDGKIYKFRKVN